MHCDIVKIKAGYGLPKNRSLFPSYVLISHVGVIEDLSPGMLRLLPAGPWRWQHYFSLKYRELPVDTE